MFQHYEMKALNLVSLLNSMNDNDSEHKSFSNVIDYVYATVP